VRLLGHWWNGSKVATTRRDVVLRANPAGLFEVEYRHPGRLEFGEYPTLARAQRVVAALLGDGAWTRLDSQVARQRRMGPNQIANS